MKSRLLYFIGFTFLLASCGTYNYYPHTVNPGFFANQGEAQVEGYISSAGFAATGGYAITNQISVMGMFAGNPGTGSYHAREGELSVGFNTGRNESVMMFGGAIGYGFGSNFDRDSAAFYNNYSANFSRPFVVMSLGGVSLKEQGVKVDLSFSLRVNYLLYNGSRTNSDGVTTSFNGSPFYYEPYFRASIGGENVRFNFGSGFSFKNLGEWGEGVRVFPVPFNFGIGINIGRRFGDERL